MERRFQSVKVEAPIADEAILISERAALRSTRTITRSSSPKGAIEPPSSFPIVTSPTAILPDKAIDLMDEAGSRARIGTMTRPPKVKQLEKPTSRKPRHRKEKAIKNQDFEGAAAMRDQEKHAKEKLETL